VSAERSWGTDAVAMGREAGSEQTHAELRQRRVSRPKLPPRALALGALALAVAVGLGLTLGGESNPRQVAPIREVIAPLPHVAGKPPAPMPRLGPRHASKPHVKRKRATRLECKPNASATPHDLDAPEAAPEATPEPVTEPAPKAASPAPARPTSGSAEFGM